MEVIERIEEYVNDFFKEGNDVYKTIFSNHRLVYLATYIGEHMVDIDLEETPMITIHFNNTILKYNIREKITLIKFSNVYKDRYFIYKTNKEKQFDNVDLKKLEKEAKEILKSLVEENILEEAYKNFLEKLRNGKVRNVDCVERIERI